MRAATLYVAAAICLVLIVSMAWWTREFIPLPPAPDCAASANACCPNAPASAQTCVKYGEPVVKAGRITCATSAAVTVSGLGCA